MKTEQRQPRFVLCVRNDGSEELQPRKVYQVVPDLAASRQGYVRVIDESEEDYLYPADYFVPVRLSTAVMQRFALPSSIALEPTAAQDRVRKRRSRAGRG